MPPTERHITDVIYAHIPFSRDECRRVTDAILADLDKRGLCIVPKDAWQAAVALAGEAPQMHAIAQTLAIPAEWDAFEMQVSATIGENGHG